MTRVLCTPLFFPQKNKNVRFLEHVILVNRKIRTTILVLISALVNLGHVSQILWHSFTRLNGIKMVLNFTITRKSLILIFCVVLNATDTQILKREKTKPFPFSPHAAS